MTRLHRISEITKPRGPISKSKLYADARAGLVEIRKIGGMSAVPMDSWASYIEGTPMIRNATEARS